MEMNKLLKGISNCGCGKEHPCDIRYVEVSAGALEKLPVMLESFHHVLLVADTNTYAVCGDQIKKILNEKAAGLLVYESKGFLVPDERAIKLLEKQVTEKTDFILGIGSGVISDLCKYVSFQKKRSYGIVATAPSMDGYASVGAAMIVGGMKVTYSAHVPYLIAADSDILKNAPLDMIKSGYGDIIGKYSALNDWELSREINGEYFCRMVFGLVYDRVERVKPMGIRLAERRREDIVVLMEALIEVGIAMSYVGNSRPASGSEHHLAHFFEVTGILNKEPYYHHGIDVFYSSFITQRLRERILAREAPLRPVAFDQSRWEKEIRSLYGSAADGVMQLQEKLGWYRQDRIPAYRARWEDIVHVLKRAPSSQEIRELLRQAGLPVEDLEKQYGRNKITQAIWYAKDLKDRYTVLWLYYDLFFDETLNIGSNSIKIEN